MARVLLVTIVFCAISLVKTRAAIQFPPPYLKWVDNYERASIALVQKAVGGVESEEPEVLKTRFHYRLLVAVLGDISKVLSYQCPPTYDEYYYISVKNGVANGWQNNLEVAEKTQDFLKRVDHAVKPVFDLVKEKCKDGIAGCEYGVYNEITKYPAKYKVSSEIFEAVSKVSEEYLKNIYSKEAEKHETVKLVLEGKEKLRKLVQLLVFVIQDVHFYGVEKSKVDKKCSPNKQ